MLRILFFVCGFSFFNNWLCLSTAFASSEHQDQISSLNKGTCIPDISTSSIRLGESLYLNGCGPDPQEYFSKPFNLENIYEVPNYVVAKKENPYGRAIQTTASSVIHINNVTLKATLDNFRDLKIVDSAGKILSQRKITGATSLFEIKLKNNNIAWAVGWHNNSRSAYKIVDFTVFRVYFPIIENGKLAIQERVFKGLAQSRYQNAIIGSDQVMLIEGTQIGTGCSGCYYCFPDFIVLDSERGMVSIQDLKDLEKFIDYKKIDPLLFVFWLTNKKDIKNIRQYIDDNYDRVFSAVIQYAQYFDIEPFKDFMKPTKEACKLILKQDTPFSAEAVYAIFDACFPLIRHEEYYLLWLEDVMPPN